MQYPTCRHIKLDGTYCGSPSLRDRKYCYHHLMARGRRLRRARALRDNLPYRIELPVLTDLDAVQFALSEITQAVGSGQLDHRAAGKMLYAIQQATSILKFRANLAAAQPQIAQDTKDANDGVPQRTVPQSLSRARRGIRALPLGANLGSANLGSANLGSANLGSANLGSANLGSQDADSRIQEYPDFEKHLGLEPGADIDAEITAVLQKAAEEEQGCRAEAMPEPPPGVRPGSPAYRVFREEAYQILRLQVNDMRHQLRDYNEQKRQQLEKMKKEVMSSVPAPERRAETA